MGPMRKRLASTLWRRELSSFPRKTLESCRTGRKKRGRLAIHLFPSRLSPPPVTITWDVGMEEQGLAPGVENGDESRGGAQVRACDLEQRLGGGREEQGVALARMEAEEGMKRRREREDQVEVRHGEEMSSLGLAPQSLIEVLAFGAVAVVTRVVERALVVAAVASVEMAAQGCRSAGDEVADDAEPGCRSAARARGGALLGSRPAPGAPREDDHPRRAAPLRSRACREGSWSPRR